MTTKTSNLFALTYALVQNVLPPFCLNLVVDALPAARVRVGDLVEESRPEKNVHEQHQRHTKQLQN